MAEEKKKLNPNQELFCQLYATDTEFFGNGLQSYVKAYKPDMSKPNWNQTARSVASEILTNPHVIARINDLLTEGGLNDQNVDKQLSFLITQHADFNAKMGAIREYNKLKQRITEKIDHTSGGKALPATITIIQPNVPDNIHPGA